MLGRLVSMTILARVILYAHLWLFGAHALIASEEDLKLDAEYDYVIIGGGTAGLVLAARLSENNNNSVAVIEAGTFYEITNPFLSSTPMFGIAFTGMSPEDTNPGVDWGFVTSPQAGLRNRELHYARGKCLGGSSGRNLMIYQRPDTGSLQRWADEVGDQSYTFQNMLAYFQKSCFFSPPGPSRLPNATARYNAAAFSAAGGPLQVSYPNNARPFSTFLGEGFAAIGIPETKDFNSGHLLGTQYCSTTIDPRTGTRSSSETSFLGAAKSRPNLKVYQLTLATRVLFDRNKKATGVETEWGTHIAARKEVILSAGAFQSPQLLMVSGVGPASTLKRLGIPVVADRPGVGKNMTDHIMFGPTYRVQVETLATLGSDQARLLLETANYLATGEGPLSNPGSEFIAWEKIPGDLLSAEAAAALATMPGSWPDVEYLSAEAYFGNWSVPLRGTPADGHNYASILIIPVSPRSRGSVTIASAAASDPPIIDPNWLTDPTDAVVAVAAYKRARALFKSGPMQAVLEGTAAEEYFPGPEVATDAQLLESIRENAATIYHAASTCRMGRPEDPTAVVDAEARVIGVAGLRVVDASAFALLPPGHPQSMVYALAEKIADLIKNED
ncbi:hypothetical protein DL765_009752 [Monosporascus sp. GIB2]|nr:hypothetical protein DL765_009752 [Monosporascus sp. GIB2]